MNLTLNNLIVLLILVIMHTVQTFLMLTVYLIIVEDVVQDSMIYLVLKLLTNAVRSSVLSCVKHFDLLYKSLIHKLKSGSRILPFISIIYLYIIGICPDDKPELNCPFNLCDHQKCLNIPDADCVFDVCGGCTARFYLGNEEVTDQCSMYNNYNSTFHNSN